MKLKIQFIVVAVAFISSCQSEFTAEQVIKKSISVHGGQVIDTSSIAFDFRNIHYKATHQNGLFKYERWYKDSIHDVLSNDGFTRYINGNKVSLSEEEKIKYSNSVNSVIYFALLPYKLDDPAVNAELNGEERIEEIEYYQIRVTFDKQGGGDDYEDEFAYWINKNDFTLDYLAYIYHDDEGGTRFRKAYNQREINGILFSNYKNFKGPFPFLVTQMDSLYNKDELEFLSDIELENIEVD